MKRVLIESPYAGDVENNIAYARKCMRDSLDRGEAPFASHLLYTQHGILDDYDPRERKLGIEAGLIWGACASLTAVYIDLGISDGMKLGIKRAIQERRPVVWRKRSPMPGLFSQIERCEDREGGGTQCMHMDGHRGPHQCVTKWGDISGE